MVKTKELEKEEVKEEVKEDNYDVIYKSKLLNKEFTDLDELKKAESEYKLEVAKKEEAKLARKEEAAVVQKAFADKNAAIKAYNDVVVEARKARLEAINKINAEYNEKIQPAYDVYEKAQAEYDKALSDFQAAHPEGYHLTLKDGDNQVILSKNSYHDIWQEMAEEWNKTFSFWNNLLK